MNETCNSFCIPELDSHSEECVKTECFLKPDGTFLSLKPVMDMIATWNCGSDAYPCTVIAMSKSGKTITIQDDLSFVISGSEYDGTAQYNYRRDPKGRIQAATLRKDGFRLKYACKGYGRVLLGWRRRYYDPSF